MVLEVRCHHIQHCFLLALHWWRGPFTPYKLKTKGYYQRERMPILMGKRRYIPHCYLVERKGEWETENSFLEHKVSFVEKWHKKWAEWKAKIWKNTKTEHWIERWKWASVWFWIHLLSFKTCVGGPIRSYRYKEPIKALTSSLQWIWGQNVIQFLKHHLLCHPDTLRSSSYGYFAESCREEIE